VGLIIQGIWAGILVLPRIRHPDEVRNLYGDLLTNISAALIFIFLNRRRVHFAGSQPEAERPYKGWLSDRANSRYLSAQL